MTTKRIAIALAFLIVPMASVLSQATGVLTGRVVDLLTRTPVAGVELMLAEKRATSDSLGAYRLTELPGGVHTISVRKVGYEALSQDIAVIVGTESSTDFQLKRVSTLDTVQTTAPATKYISSALRQFEERKKMGIGKFMDEATLRKNDDRTLGNTLRRLSGIRVMMYNSSEYVSASRVSGGGQAGSMLGGGGNATGTLADPSRRDSPRGCWVSVYLDGLAMYLGEPTQPAPDVAKILVRDLAAVEYYSGTASLPPQFSAIKSSDCGVLLLWTRER